MIANYDVVIVGTGVAGLTAALYASRQGLKAIAIGKDLGGQLLLSPEIQNYPGFKTISGYELIKRIEEQVRSFGAEVKFDEVVKVDESNGKFIAYTPRARYSAEALILTLGKSPRDLGVPGEREFKGRGVSYCTVCDAALYKGRKVALVGSGNLAVESALLLSDLVREGYWIIPSNEPHGDKELIGYIRSKGVLELLTRSNVVEIRGDKKVRAIVIKDEEGNLREIEVDGIFIELGYVTKTDFLRGFVDLNKRGEIIVDPYGRTSRRGVFAAGDVTNFPYKQAIIAASQGAIAALSAYSYLMRKRGKEVVPRDWRHLRIKEECKEGFYLEVG